MKFSTFVKWIVLPGIAVAGIAGYVVHKRRAGVLEFQTSPVVRGAIDQTVSATGSCNAVKTVQVGSQVSGNIKALNVDFNSKVKKGDVVALIDPDSLKSRLQQVQANMDVVKSSVGNANAQLRRAEGQIANSQANLAAQKANLVKARLSMQDAKSKLDHENLLFQRGMVAQEERDTVQTTYETAQAAYDAAESQVTASESSVEVSKADRDVAKMGVASAEAQQRQMQATLDQAEIDLQHTEITSPVDGTVISRKMDVGQTVAASFSAPTIFEIAEDLTKMQVEANVDEADVGLVRVGQNATFTVDAYPEEQFTGQINQIRKAPNVVQNVVTYTVIIAVDNNELKLLPGMTASIRVRVDRRENVLKFPNAALRIRAEDVGQTVPIAAPTPVPAGPQPQPQAADSATTSSAKLDSEIPIDLAGPLVSTIWKVNALGKPVPVKIKLGISDGRDTEVREVLDGTLEAGDKLVTSTGPVAFGAPAQANSKGGGPPPG